MTRLLRSLRVRLAIAGFGAIYLPVLLLSGVVFVTATEDVEEPVVGGAIGRVVETTSTADTSVSPWVLVTLLALIPVAGLLSWWWSGRAMRPIEEATAVQEHLLEEASHELRTPLSVLTANADVLLTHPNPSVDDYRRGIERSGSAALRMSATLDALLVDARGRARTIDRRPTLVAELVERATDALAPLAEQHDVSFRVRADRAAHARIDPDTVERAINNLLTNAIEHSPPGATVDLGVTRTAEGVELAVTDRGPGIAPEDQPRIFRRYWQRDDNDGSGIGLAVVEHIAHAHGGAITVESPIDNGEGTRFRLQLPA